MKTIVFLILILSPIFSRATAQLGDIIIFKGDTLALFSNPLEQHPKVDSLRSIIFGGKQVCEPTSCSREYVAEWTMIENILYLTNIFSCCYKEDSIKANLESVFPKEYKNGKIVADWVSGYLIAPKGKLIHYFHGGYHSIYEKEIELYIKEGYLIGERELDNSRSHKSVYSQKLDTLREFVYCHVNWKKLPDMQEKAVRVVVTVQSGMERRVGNVTAKGKSEEYKPFNDEVIRVLKLLPDWDVYYRHGEPIFQSVHIPFVFNEEIRNKYRKKKLCR